MLWMGAEGQSDGQAASRHQQGLLKPFTAWLEESLDAGPEGFQREAAEVEEQERSGEVQPTARGTASPLEHVFCRARGAVKV